MKWNDDAFTVRRYIGIGGLVASAVVLALAARLTIAYLGDSTEKKENTLKVGYGDVSIEESFEEPSELRMTNDITKEVKVRNKSTVPAFVRVYAEFSDSEIAKQAKVVLNGTEYSWSDFKERLESGTIDSKWRYVPPYDSENNENDLGGYFYYTEALNAETDSTVGDVTGPLFNRVIIDYNEYSYDERDETDVPVDSNIDRIVPLEMIIYSELIQTVDTGRTKVTATTVDGEGSAITGEGIENPVESSVYGYDFNKAEVGTDEWKDAWRRFLKLKSSREQSETVQ